MKKWIPVLFLGVLLVSCVKEDANLLQVNLAGATFTHDIPNCDNEGNYEINCTEFVKFIDKSRADVLVGGSDIISRLSYELSEEKIILDQGDGIDFDISFKVQDEQTIVRMEDGSIWRKEQK